MHYTLEQLQQKSLTELKDIGHQLNVLPEGDRRLRRNWIRAIVEQAASIDAEPTPESSPGVESVSSSDSEVNPADNEQAQEAIEAAEYYEDEDAGEWRSNEDGFFDNIYGKPEDMRSESAQEPIAPLQLTECFDCEDGFITDRWGDIVECPRCDGSRWREGAPDLDTADEMEFPSTADSLKEPTDASDLKSILTGEPPLESKFGRIVYPRPAAKTEPKVSQSAIVPAAKNSPGVSRKASTAHQLLDLFNSRAQIIQSPAEPEAPIQTAIEVADTADRNQILTGITFSDTFLATYSPPQSKTIHYHADADGQLSVLDSEVEETNEPPDPDHYSTLEQFWCVMNAWNATFTDSVEQFTELPQHNNAEHIGIDTEREGAREISAIAPTPSRRNVCSEHDGASLHRHDERLGSLQGDRILEISRHDSGDSGGIVPHQSTKLVQPQALTEQRPPGRGDGRGGDLELAIGMLVGRRRDRQHIGKILDIYKSRRGIWRAKIRPLNKPNCAYYDCAALIEQRLLYDYGMKPGGFLPSGQVFDKNRGENFQVFSRKVRSAKPTNWTPEQLSELSIFKLKQIAREMDIPAIPGSVGKRSLTRAILAEQAIAQEKAAAQREKETSRAVAQKAPPANKQKRAAASPLGNQLSLFDLAV